MGSARQNGTGTDQFSSPVGELLEQLSDTIVIYSLDIAGNFTHVSPSSGNVLGFKPSDAIGRNFSEFYAADPTNEGVKERFARTLAGESQPAIERVVNDANGVRRVLRVVDAPLFDSDGVVRGIQGVALDVTEQFEREQELVEGVRARTEALVDANRELTKKEALLSALFMLGPVASTLTRLSDGKIVEVNDAFVSMTGYGRDEAIGKTTSDVGLHVEERRANHVDALANASSLQAVELDFITKSGERRRSLRSVSKLLIDGVEHLVGQTIDVTEQYRAEGKLRESETRMRMLLNSTGEGIFGIDLEGHCTFCNQAALRVVGYKHEADVLGRQLHEVVGHAAADGNPVDATTNPILRATRNGVECHVEDDSFRRTDGVSFPIEYRSVPIVEEGAVTGAVVSFDDISERRANEAWTRAHNRARLEAARRATAEQFAADLAHELNQPFNAISSYCDAMMSMAARADLPKEMIETMQAAHAQVLRAGDIIKSIRRSVSAAPANIEAVDVSALVNEAAALVAMDARDYQVAIDVDVDERAVKVQGERVRLQQVLVNLLLNAIEALGTKAPQGGRVVLSVVRSEEALVFSVIDDGPGVPEDLAPQVFDPLVSGKEGGMGIGLSICKQIVDSHQGRLWLEATPHGTTMRFTVPVGNPDG